MSTIQNNDLEKIKKLPDAQPVQAVYVAEGRTMSNFDIVGFIIAVENGEASEDEVVEGFQHLIDTGTAWSLQGSYGRAAKTLIEQGLCTI